MLLNVSHLDWIDLLRLSPEGTRLAITQEPRSESERAVLVVQELPSGREMRRCENLQRVTDVVFRSEDELFVLHGTECRLCDLAKNRQHVLWLGDATKASGYPSKGALSPDKKTLALGVGGGLLLLDIARKRLRRQFAAPLGGHVHTATFSPDGTLVAAEFADGNYLYFCFVLVWDVQREKLVRLLKVDAQELRALAIRPDNRLIAIGGWYSPILVYRLEELSRRRMNLKDLSERTLLYGVGWTEAIAALAEHPHAPGFGNAITRLDFTANGRTLKAVSYDGDAVRLTPQNGRVLRRVRPPDGQKVGSAVVSEPGLAAAFVGDRKTVLLWDVPGWCSK
jgi:WD40 repeat protein